MARRDRGKGASTGRHGREEAAKAHEEPGPGRTPGRAGERDTRERLAEVRRKADDDVDPHEWPDQGDGTATPV
ncbi:hypothetical protein AF335_19375 [Streptomyces eurocidicus]|uniref:Uncharacterized protein n=1 Tax=Streptomyces eurocidicus TaxID=66423 RepID=A0A2N8NT78_STREU|nr:hypothetical protein [Streptomyces eurocidicus]MBB5119232.1 hypothetical protein [Streptomyces eurocidicus]MBF6053180.1 hypothetical protein [Streptomyces eurocidicus]PNE31954.1 hypothetical protein AF335_19375 [Streptomyces eurocidicus]